VEYVEWIGGLRVIVLDSSVPGAPYGTVRPDQLAWLKAELETPAADGTLLVLHHPPVPDPTRLAGLLTLHGSTDLEKVVRGSDVVAVLAGHAHHGISATFAGVLCFAAPATSYIVDPLVLTEQTLRGLEGGGFGVIRVFDRHAVALTLPMPGSGAETYRMQLSDEVLQRWSGTAVAATA
jgi:3',5'-cyclic AMP phosphodiesterase CpdA